MVFPRNTTEDLYTAGFGSSCHIYLFWCYDFFRIDRVLNLGYTLLSHPVLKN
jgi:hypothetical protein